MTDVFAWDKWQPLADCSWGIFVHPSFSSFFLCLLWRTLWCSTSALASTPAAQGGRLFSSPPSPIVTNERCSWGDLYIFLQQADYKWQQSNELSCCLWRVGVANNAWGGPGRRPRWRRSWTECCLSDSDSAFYGRSAHFQTMEAPQRGAQILAYGPGLPSHQQDEQKLRIKKWVFIMTSLLCLNVCLYPYLFLTLK